MIAINSTNSSKKWTNKNGDISKLDRKRWKAERGCIGWGNW